MEIIVNYEILKSAFLIIAILFFVLLLAIYALLKIRRGYRQVSKSDLTLEKHRIGGANKEISFVFDTFQQTLKEITLKKQELIRMHQDAVDQVRQMERYNECILESMVSGVVAFDCREKLTAMNEAAAEILEWPADISPIGRSGQEILKGSSQMKAVLTAVLQENRRILREEVTFHGGEGIRKWLGVNASPLIGADGGMIGATILFTDLTQVKELQRQVELKNRLAVMGEMSAGIAHEFRNSLGAILGYARLIDRQGGGDELLREAAEGIISEVKSFDAMLADFLQFARPTELNREECDLAAIARDAVDLLSDESEKRGARVELTAAVVPTVLADPTLIRQAIINLVKNALQATGDAGQIQVDVRPEGNQVQIRVQDNGSGISEEDQKRIFEPFFTTKRDGTGLGLAITQKTILAHHGEITIKSDPGQGTMMIVSLPMG